jgi:hypothetical protein
MNCQIDRMRTLPNGHNSNITTERASTEAVLYPMSKTFRRSDFLRTPDTAHGTDLGSRRSL